MPTLHLDHLCYIENTPMRHSTRKLKSLSMSIRPFDRHALRQLLRQAVRAAFRPSAVTPVHLPSYNTILPESLTTDVLKYNHLANIFFFQKTR